MGQNCRLEYAASMIIIFSGGGPIQRTHIHTCILTVRSITLRKKSTVATKEEEEEARVVCWQYVSLDTAIYVASFTTTQAYNYSTTNAA